jgi:uncharacterized membrane protein
MPQEQPLRNRLALFLLVVIVTMGVIFRCAHLDWKVYWGDEVYSSLRIFGYRTMELSQAVVTGQPVSAALLQQFQQLDPARGIGQVIEVLKVEDSHLTPLYFVIARMWANWFGDSTAAIRSLSVVFSLLTLPAIFGLAQELFRSRRIGLIAVAIVAISPIHLVFAQEARFYSIWLLTMVLACWALLRAMRVGTGTSWLNFGLALILSFYAQFLSLINWAGLALYFLIAGGWRDRRNRNRFIVSSGAALASFTPWLYFYLMREKVDTLIPSGESSSIPNFLRNIFVNLSRLFLDLNATTRASRPEMLLLLGVTALGGGVMVMALWQLWRRSSTTDYSASRHSNQPHQPFYFLGVMALTLPVFLFEMATKSALPPRYTLISYVAMQLAIAAWIDAQMRRPSAPVQADAKQLQPAVETGYQMMGNGTLILDRVGVEPFVPPVTANVPPQLFSQWRNNLWLPLVLILLGCSIISCGKMIQAESWWNKQFSTCNPAIARVVNQSENALVISDVRGAKFFDDALSNVVSLARLTKPTVQFQLIKEGESVTVAPGFRDRYVLMPSEHLRNQLEQQYSPQFRPVLEAPKPYRDSKVCLWQF